MGKTSLPKAESLILFAFLGCIVLWGISKCSNRRSEMVRKVREIGGDDDTEERPVRRDTVVVSAPTTPQVTMPLPKTEAPIPAPTQYTTTAKQPGALPERPAPSSTPPASQPSTPAAKSASTLYVTIDGLKVRKEPGLKGEAVEQLKLYEPVTFLNQKTEWKQEISLGYEKVTDHWVKIRTASGKVGWVFGAGVHFYKTKREGVINDSKPAENTPKKKN